MTKKPLSLAIIAALALPGVAAADITIYGRLAMSLDYLQSDRGDRDDISDFQVASNASLLGFKGTEGLGGGLKAIWQVETALQLEEQFGNRWATRNSFLGLSGGWGTAIAGKHDTPMKIVSRKLDPFVNTALDTRAMLGISSQGANNFNLRPSNTFAYISPQFSGFTGILALVADPTDNSAAPSDNDNAAVSASITYSNGPIYAAVAYEKHKADKGPEPGGFRVGGSYKVAGFKFGAMYEKFDGDASTNNPADSDYNVNALAIDRGAFSLFGTYTFGSNTAKLEYTQTQESDLKDDKAFMIGLGLDHKFSKRTKVYVLAGLLNNKDDRSNYFIGDHGVRTDTFNTRDAGEKQKVISFGMEHRF